MSEDSKNNLPGVLQWAPHESDLWRKEVDLRYRILRVPLGLHFTQEQLDAEKSEHHLVYMEGEEVLGCLILTDKPGARLKMRQVAVDERRQGQGIGKLMVQYSENFARKTGYVAMECNARDTAVPFYQSLGWKTVGDMFEEVTIPHFKMEKIL
jgi:predicted GNAT family N-acyltransferase